MEYVLLADNRRLAAPELARAKHTMDEVGKTLDDRIAAMERHGLDAEFGLPNGIWALDSSENDFSKTAQFLRRAPGERLNFLRFHTSHFTGYSLLHLRPRHPQHGFDDPIREDYDAWLPSAMVGPFLDGWQHFMTRTPPDFRFLAPRVCGEVGFDIDGAVVNFDTCSYQERMTLLWTAGLFRFLNQRIEERGYATVLEIGGGYGALAQQIRARCRNVSYTICDLPESLVFSGAYLSITLPDLAVRALDANTILEERHYDENMDVIKLLPNYLLPLLDGVAKFDLVINTLSMSEMTEFQIRTYGRIVSNMIGETGLFFEQNQDNSHLHLTYSKRHLPDYFSHRQTVYAPQLKIRHGIPDVWSNGTAFELRP